MHLYPRMGQPYKYKSHRPVITEWNNALHALPMRALDRISGMNLDVAGYFGREHAAGVALIGRTRDKDSAKTSLALPSRVSSG